MTSTAAKPGNRRPAIDPRFAQRWIDARRQEGRRRLRVLIGAGSVAAVAVIAAGVLYSPAFEVRHVDVTETAVGGGAPQPVSGLSGVAASPPAQNQLATLAGIDGHPLMIRFDASAAARRLAADPWLADVRVARAWPDSVRVSAVSRVPVAAVATGAKGSASGYALIDPTGRVLAISSTAPVGLPLLSVYGAVPAPGGWLVGTVGAGADPTLPAAQLTDMNAGATADDVPAPATAALAVVDSLPAATRAEVTAVSTTPALTFTVVAPATRGASVQFQFGDGTLLAAKISALETLVSQADLSGVKVVDLTVPSRPEATGSGTSSSGAASSGTSAPAQGGTSSSGG